MQQPPFNAYRFDEFRLDLNGRCLLDGDGKKTELTLTEFELLKYLCGHPKTFISKEKLIKDVWQRTVDEGIVKVYISDIRKKLGEKGTTIIISKHKHGYMLDCDVEKLREGSGGEKGMAGVDVLDEVISAREPDAVPARSGGASDKSLKIPLDAVVMSPAERGKESESADPAELDDEARTAFDHGPHKQKTHEDRGHSAPKREDTDSNDANMTFERWLSSSGLLPLVVLLCCVGTTFALSIGVANNWGRPNNAQMVQDAQQMQAAQAARDAQAMRVASTAQGVVIFLMFLHSLFWAGAKRFRQNEECREADIVKAGFKDRLEFENERAGLENSLKKYTWFWRGLLLSWIPLYYVFARGKFPDDELWVAVLNLVNTFMLGGCLYSLNKHVDEQDREHLGGGVVNVVMSVLLVCVFITLLAAGDKRGATLLTGIMAGITMALYIGRLQSRFIGTRFGILYWLYSYTAIQPLVLYIQDHPELGWKILVFALFLKCLLYIYMAWLFQSGLLLFYFARVKQTDTPLREQRKAFRKLL